MPVERRVHSASSDFHAQTSSRRRSNLVVLALRLVLSEALLRRRVVEVVTTGQRRVTALAALFLPAAAPFAQAASAPMPASAALALQPPPELGQLLFRSLVFSLKVLFVFDNVREGSLQLVASLNAASKLLLQLSRVLEFGPLR